MKRDKRVRVRFAPSPTGDLHVGNARTALLNWLFARHHGGDFILRVEDTDRVRTSDVYERNILEDLRWLGIDWDEGPEKDGPFGPYRQSGRLEIYRGYLERLVAEGRAYRCYCTEEELEKERAGLLSRGKAPRYGGRCRNLTVEQGKKFDDEGRAYAYRFRVEEGLIEFTDLIRGPMKFNAEDIGDFIVLRSNAVPAYNFAVVIDDYLMKVSHVIRGEDHLSNTAAQLMLYAAFGFTPPVFAHHALILGKDRAKLSKRHGSVTVREFRRQGILPEAMVNYLALMGSSYGEGREVMTLAEIVNEFSLDRIGKGGAVFDEEKLDWLNTMYIRKLDLGGLTARVIPFLEEAGLDVRSRPDEWVEAVLGAVKGNLKRLSDAPYQVEIFFDEHFKVSVEAASLLRQNESRAVLAALQEALTDGNCPERGFYAFAIDFVRGRTGMKGKAIFTPIRAAVTGRLEGPELSRVFDILDRGAILKRVARALASAGASGTKCGCA